MEHIQSEIDTFSLPLRIYYSPYSHIRIAVLVIQLADITNKLRRNNTS